ILLTFSWPTDIPGQSARAREGALPASGIPEGWATAQTKRAQAIGLRPYVDLAGRSGGLDVARLGFGGDVLVPEDEGAAQRLDHEDRHQRRGGVERNRDDEH